MIQINCTERVARSEEGLRAENTRLRRKLATAEADAALNAIMVREGDHRIKNSLQIVVSLLRLQARSKVNPSVSHAVLSAVARIQAVARVHDALGLGGYAGTVDLAALVQSMCASIMPMTEGTGIGIEAHLDPLHVSATSARSVMLAANELVINAIRHAYPDGGAGVIRVSVRREGGEVRIVVADDGVGIPRNRFESAEGYGLKLVRMMVEQLGGALCIDGSAGTTFSMIIPASPALLGISTPN